MTIDSARTTPLLDTLREIGIIAIVRNVPAARLVDTAVALAAGGVRAIEVTFDTPGALDAIGRWRGLLPPEVMLGVGTVLSSASAERAIDAGAQFLVAPNIDESVVATAVGRGVDMVPGAFTPTEILRAWNAGATAVKVFPAAPAGGPRYISSLMAPLGPVPMIAVGGVHPGDVPAYLAAGAVAVGLGLSLVDRDLVAAGAFDEMERRARAVVTAVQEVIARE